MARFALLIDENVKSDIKRVIQYAESHIHSYEEVMKRLEDVDAIPGNKKEFTCLIPYRFKVVYSIDTAKDGTIFKHISISNESGRYPHPNVIMLLVKEFGFRGKNIFDFYNVSPEANGVIHVIELYDTVH